MVPLASANGAPIQHIMSMGLHRQAGPNMLSAIQKFNNLSSIKVQQKAQPLDGQACCSKSNMYLIYDTIEKPKAGARPAQELFFVHEEQNGCAMLPGDCRPWQMVVHDLPPPEDRYDEGDVGEPFLLINRPWSCACCPCQKRAKARISEVPSDRTLGYLDDPQSNRCCFVRYQVLDSNENVRLDTKSCTGCKIGPCCRCPGCKMDFDVMDVEDGEVAAKIRKKWTCGECCPLPCCPDNWEHYGVVFEKDTENDYKMMLMSLAVFIHVRFFDHPSQGQPGNTASSNVGVDRSGISKFDVGAAATMRSMRSVKSQKSSTVRSVRSAPAR